jgi:cytochrome c-type biogenesis protein CcmE
VSGPFRRLFGRFSESDEERLANEIRTWASEIPGTVRISDARSREQVRIAGVIKRITVYPAEGSEAVEGVISDGTGEISVVWMGRRSIPGLRLGTRVLVEGVLAEGRGSRRKMVNPKFEFRS